MIVRDVVFVDDFDRDDDVLLCDGFAVEIVNHNVDTVLNHRRRIGDVEVIGKPRELCGIIVGMVAAENLIGLFKTGGCSKRDVMVEESIFDILVNSRTPSTLRRYPWRFRSHE